MPIASNDTAALITGLLGAVTGKSGTSKTTGSNTTTVANDSQSQTVTGSNITPEGVKGLIDQILGGSGGLADLASGAKTAGIYNSSTQQLLSNDLIARTAAQVAAQAAGTTSTTKNTGGTTTTVNKNEETDQEVKSPLGSLDLNAIGGAAGLAGLYSLLAPSIKAGVGSLTGGKGVGDLGTLLRDALFGTGVAPNADKSPSFNTGSLTNPLGTATGSPAIPSIPDDFWASIGIDPSGVSAGSGDSGLSNSDITPDWWFD